MVRTEKGKSISHYVSDYCVIDLETTGVFLPFAKIIEISAIKVRNNEIVDEFSSLINPLCHIPMSATAINHITDDMVKDAPNLDNVIDDFISFVGDDIIVGYNNASFDINLIYDSLIDLRNSYFSNNYIDLLYAARRCIHDVDNHKLKTICHYLSIDTTGEHRALKDCYLTKQCYDSLFKQFGNRAFEPASHDSQKKQHIFSAETQKTQDLITQLKTILADNVVKEDEFNSLKAWVENNTDLEGTYVFDRLYSVLCSVMEKGNPTEDNLQEMIFGLKEIVDPVNSLECKASLVDFEGKHICVTGDFNFGSRYKVIELIEQTGALFDKSVRKTTNILVVGAKGSENWITENYGNKVKKAMEYNNNGACITIMKESDFIQDAIKCINNEAGEKQSLSSSEESSWTTGITDMLNNLAIEMNLPEGSLRFEENKNEKGSITSYFVYIWEPDYPPANTIPECNMKIATITPSKAKSRPDDLDLQIAASQECALKAYLPLDAVVLPSKSEKLDNAFSIIRINRHSPLLVEYIKQNAIYCVNNYTSKANVFGCCSLFEKCSDSKRCLHSNLLYSRACVYRDNLEKGNIFYGKDKNV